MESPERMDLVVSPGPDEGTVRTASGQVLEVPAGWVLVPPGDALRTRRVRERAHTWRVEIRRGRKVFSRGTWAPAAAVTRVDLELESLRGSDAHRRSLERSRDRRRVEQDRYTTEFHAAIRRFLAFHPRYAAVEGALADRVCAHAVPVGSGTVARTRRIPVADRARAAVIAWLRHQTTDYEERAIARVKGARREVRRELAARSLRLLDRYRAGQAPGEAPCPLLRALDGAVDPGPGGSE